jgi:hypothetical protein
MWSDTLKRVIVESQMPATRPVNNIFDLLNTLANIAILVGVGLSFVGLAISFFSLITSSGDPKAAEKAKNGITWSVLAMFVCALAYTAQQIFLYLIGAGSAAE